MKKVFELNVDQAELVEMSKKNFPSLNFARKIVELKIIEGDLKLQEIRGQLNSVAGFLDNKKDNGLTETYSALKMHQAKLTELFHQLDLAFNQNISSLGDVLPEDVGKQKNLKGFLEYGEAKRRKALEQGNILEFSKWIDEIDMARKELLSLFKKKELSDTKLAI
ncbi:hypothetical protein [Bacillus pseudomycoides]|uniref:hypothetical protein n=1 Tax=Bacillus pseudomycoides TaxID=64104 RepID=UPI000BF0E878|nr:hypothetical protein [Bacillus pseudomycoides]PEM69361.1 hypothetical protein CN619_21750 [Bacillus pseudomycoides]PGA62167.1 hypothetical protein COL84_13405 [Bacillus pseudomycoides]